MFQSDLINTLYLKYPSQKYFEHYIMSVNKGTLVRFGEGSQVADRRRWQSAMTSPIGDVGSERVKATMKQKKIDNFQYLIMLSFS